MALRAIFYDTETTGIRPEKDRIIELAAYDPTNGKTFVQLINPGCPIPKEAMAIHHITDEMVADAPPFSNVGYAFVEFCQGECVLIAHNNDNFDKLFLRYEFERNGIPFPEWKFLDTLKWARKYRPDLPRHSLQFLREIYGIPPNQAHRALDDVIVLHEVFRQMIDDLDYDTVHDLMNSSTRSMTCMPFGKHQGSPLHLVPSEYVQWLKNSGAFEKPENLELKLNFEKLGLLNIS